MVGYSKRILFELHLMLLLFYQKQPALFVTKVSLEKKPLARFLFRS